MNVARYRMNAQSALIALDSAVMGVMYEANEPLKPARISRYLDIPVLARKSIYEYAIVQNVLYRLECEGLARQTDEGPWVLTQKGLESFE